MAAVSAHFKQTDKPNFAKSVAERIARPRDRAIRVLEKTHTEYPAYYITCRNGVFDPQDGIIETDIGFFRAAYDHETGRKLLVFSRNIEALEMQHRETDGSYKFQPLEADEDVEVYIAGGHDKDVTGERMREHMRQVLMREKERVKYFRQSYLEPTPTNESDLDGAFGYRLASNRATFGLFQLPKPTIGADGHERTWHVKARPALSGAVDATDDFVRLPLRPPGGLVPSVFAQGQTDVQDQDSAFEMARNLAHKSARDDWRGEMNVAVATPKTRLGHVKKAFKDGLASAAREFNQAVTRRHVQGTTIGFFVGVGATLVQNIDNNTLFVAQAMLGGAVLGIGIKGIETFIEWGLERTRGNPDELARMQNRPIVYKDYSQEYIDADLPGNKSRSLPKVDRDILARLEPLTMREAKMAPPSREPNPEHIVFSDDQHLQEKRLFNQYLRVEGATICPFGDKMLLGILYPNGIFSLRDCREQPDEGILSETRILYFNLPAAKISDRAPNEVAPLIQEDSALLVVERGLSHPDDYEDDRAQNPLKTFAPTNIPLEKAEEIARDMIVSALGDEEFLDLEAVLEAPDCDSLLSVPSLLHILTETARAHRKTEIKEQALVKEQQSVQKRESNELASRFPLNQQEARERLRQTPAYYI